MLKAVKEKGDFGTPYLLSTIGHNYTKASNFAQCKNKIFFLVLVIDLKIITHTDFVKKLRRVVDIHLALCRSKIL